MVESNSTTLRLDSIFGCLADPTRRDIIRRLTKTELTVGAIAESYTMSFAAVAKHIQVLERAKLIQKRRHGKHMVVTVVPQAFRDADEYISWHLQRMEQRFDALQSFLQKNP